MIVIINFVLIVIALLLFGFIIFAHELGHFATAKWFGVKVNEFAIGMGPTIFKFQKGETKYSLRLFPIGGFCAMEGEDEESEDEGSFSKKAAWKRMIIVSAGVIMNFLTGFILMILVLVQQPRFASTTIGAFAEDSVSNQYGLEVGDRIKSINGYKVTVNRDINIACLMSKNKSSFDVKVDRNGETVELHDVNFKTTDIDDQNKIASIDFAVQPIEKNFVTLISHSFNYCTSTVRMVWASVVGLIRGQFKLNEVAGPVGAVSAISQAASAGLETGFIQAINNILLMMMMLAVNLSVINILPLPALDGGRLVFLLIEAIRRKPINPKYEGYVHAAGIVLLMLFMLLITFSDVLRIFNGKGLGG